MLVLVMALIFNSAAPWIAGFYELPVLDPLVRGLAFNKFSFNVRAGECACR